MLDKDTGGELVAGVGVYLAPIMLNRLIPNEQPIQGKKIWILFSGV